jgi:hypothetical protein
LRLLNKRNRSFKIEEQRKIILPTHDNIISITLKRRFFAVDLKKMKLGAAVKANIASTKE